jgi:signal transduction histidine kinase
MSNRAAGRLGWSIWALSLAFLVAFIPLYATLLGALSAGVIPVPPDVTDWLPRSGWDVVLEIAFLLAFLSFSTLGALIASRQPRNPVGWIFCAVGLLEMVAAFTQVYALHSLLLAPDRLPGGPVAAWLQNWIWTVSFGLLLVFLPLLFPAGRLASPRWRPLAWLAGGAIASLFFAAAFHAGPVWNSDPLSDVQNPLGIQGFDTEGAFFPVVALSFGLLLISMLAAAISVVFRLRLAVGEERQQVKWFAYFAGLLVALFVIQAIVRHILSASTPTFEVAWGLAWVVAYAGLPIATGLAILKYRLYDIDLIINRTLVYGALTAGTVGLYVLLVGYLGALFQAGGNILLSLLATGLVAVLFQPLRDRLQRGVNRLMYGERDDPYAVLARLGQRLEATLAPEAVLPTIVETVAQALRLPYAAIALRPDDGRTAEDNRPPSFGDGPAIAAAFGQPVSDLLRLPLAYQNEPIGELLLAPRARGEGFGPADRRLLDQLARQAGAAAHAVCLTDDLQRARERLVTAREEERRRLRRDLHDGLGPALAAQTLKAGSARALFRRDPVAADALLGELEAGIAAALADIRRLVHNLRPPALDEQGLVGAIRESAAQYGAQNANGLRVAVEAPERLPPLPAAVEVAAFRIVQESVANVLRHARAHTCDIRLWLDEALRVSVTDDGIGLPKERHAGVGLASMRERAEELGGTCLVEALPGGGTRVLAELPLSS